jgi:hypothetical protein
VVVGYSLEKRDTRNDNGALKHDLPNRWTSYVPMCLSAALIIAALRFAPLATILTAQPAGDPPAAETLWLEGNKIKLKTTIYKSSKLNAHLTLIVVLHGDLLGFRELPASTYHYVFADEVTRKLGDVVAAAVLRPGYRDHSGERSEGELGRAIGDNYTADRVDAIARSHRGVES